MTWFGGLACRDTDSARLSERSADALLDSAPGSLALAGGSGMTMLLEARN
jgi:hypothetical protein